ncbi:MAG TPA: 7-cyano-7-deazaguanine synthase QueC [Candidatus Omnitrophota bacterium]|nr:7-cyano-7-deazaguanine synthase QueC [Candidatus Omnitrophota bacterium]HPD84704.1 7-cyano-7-deazaguanine synthase QueC [Candidatus Omnitrophota bacterium]HRZ03562.1 7-cyano-7-deazaguanine synthase QueC [Candidatus Omnitrophota bacterium]
MNNKRAVVLLSGGLDSTTALFFARAQGYKVFALIFDYGQRHRKEIKVAQKIAREIGCVYTVLKINLPWKGSALLDKNISLPQNRNLVKILKNKIPATYVPARNIIFLSFAASYAEAVGAQAIFIGANIRDYSGYPDCRPEFFKAFRQVLAKGIKAGVEGKTIEIKTPLIRKDKSQIIKLGLSLKVPYQMTWSCYRGGETPCGRCDSCILRKKGFDQLGIKDPLLAVIQ